MSFPLRNLPVVQNWDCHLCGECCRMDVVITLEEKRRIEGLDLAGDDAIASGPWFARAGGRLGNWKLRHRPDGSCVFLTSGGRCRLHERFGADVKPFACRLYPFVLIPAGDHWRVGMRFSCPSAAANAGRPVPESVSDLEHLLVMLEHHVGRSADSAPAPALGAGQQASWPDVCRVVEVLLEIVRDRGDRLERRLRKCLAMARIGGQTRFDQLQGGKLSKYLRAVRNALDAEVPRDPADVPPPDRMLGAPLFRALLAIFARVDHGAQRKPGLRPRLSRALSAWRFVKGRGPVPRINQFLPEARFEEIEQRVGVPPELDEVLERYYVVKLNSLQFCGPPNFNLAFWPGLESLVLTLPMVLWLTRAFHDRPPLQAVEQAIQLVDDHFGGDPMVGFPHVQYLMRLLSQRGELEKLVAWYGR